MNGENPSSQGNAGEMYQFPVILNPILLSRRVRKLRIDLKTRIFVDAQVIEPLWLYVARPKRSVLPSPFPVLQLIP